MDPDPISIHPSLTLALLRDTLVTAYTHLPVSTTIFTIFTISVISIVISTTSVISVILAIHYTKKRLLVKDYLKILPHTPINLIRFYANIPANQPYDKTPYQSAYGTESIASTILPLQ